MAHIRIIFLLLLTTSHLAAQPGQIPIPRIELMPNQPAPYSMRDWRQVAARYDSFVYDASKTGQYLPLVTLVPQGTNYPQNPFFKLRTYVGTNSPNNSEGINVLPSIVSATLSGINKTTEYGQNWVLMSQDFFSKNNEDIYLNNPGAGSGSDWWYDVMPNVFFYQINDQYPHLGDADLQFTRIADRFLASVRALGGSATPWQTGNFDYRAFNFKTMQPNPGGVHEPEAAGAYAWLLYHAYRQTGNAAYLQGAEWSIGFLDNWATNPSYELQLPYGTYTAARMNAELGTKYNVEKMVNWSFNRGPLRGWGTIVGTWGGFDVDGVVGEANDAGNDYAFQLNGVQQAAALVPMVRYDKRFARAIGKWVLNLANATRLFYPGFLSGTLQDASAWSNAHDPDRVVGYEALREKYQGLSPYSTGDALQGGWAGTNLSLYSSSSIGYLGAVVEKTNVDKILKINTLATDFYNSAAYPTYLYFNPYPQTQSVEIAVGNTPVDIYEAISETVILAGASGTVTISIPANQAILVTLTPAGGAVSFEKNKMLVNGVVVDYAQHQQAFTYAPRIQALAAEQESVEFGDTTLIFGKAYDADSGNLDWQWSASGGTILGSGATVQWIAPNVPGNYTITAIVTDESGQKDTATVILSAVAEINIAPQIIEIQKSVLYVAPGGQVDFTANTYDANGDPLVYAWSANGGTISGNGATITWTAPATEGIFQINVTVTDDEGLSAQASTTMLVKNFASTPGDIIAWYPFLGNANDISGHNLHGQLSGGALIVTDFWGHTNSACRFDGINDRVVVPANPLLNFQQGITVSAWFKPFELPSKEVFLVSHGSWQNRWKISITPEKKVRWTVNTLNTIADLDGQQVLSTDSIYHIAATYDGSLMAIYLNGQLQTYKPLTGLIRTTNLALLMGQMLPDIADYNFKGVMDEVKIFDHALLPDSVQALYQQDIPTAVGEPLVDLGQVVLLPNPASDWLMLRLPEAVNGVVEVRIFDAVGKLVLQEKIPPGGVGEWAVKNWAAGVYFVKIRTAEGLGYGRFVKQ